MKKVSNIHKFTLQKLNKFFKVTSCLLETSIIVSLSLGITACSMNKPQKKDFPLFLQNFRHKGNNIEIPELSYTFNTTAKYCVLGETTQAIKLANLYKETLDKNNPNYLYYQQAPFEMEYNLCLAYIQDSMEVLSKKISRTQEINDTDNIYKLGELKKANDALLSNIIVDKKQALDIIFNFHKRNDATNTNYWIRRMNVLFGSDLLGILALGDYYFHIPNTKEYGYKLVEKIAENGVEEAMNTLKQPEYATYRNTCEDKSHITKFYKLLDSF